MERKEAIEIVKSNLPDSIFMVTVLREALETLIPELAESEGEKIRKFLIDFIKVCGWSEKQFPPREDAIAWLKKQGEKPQGKSIMKVWKDMRCEVYAQASGNRHEPNCSDNNTKMFSLNDIDEIIEKISEQNLANSAKICKDEPKFKVGDWVIDKQGIVHQIANVVEIAASHTYGYVIVGGGYFNDNTEGVRRWTVEDAKDGDVLVSFYNKPFIYNGRFIASSVGAYCGLNLCDELVEEDFATSTWTRKDGVKPATKEQRVLLFAKMKEAGYEWEGHTKKLICK